MQARQSPTENRRVAAAAEREVFQHQPGRLPVDAPAQRFGHAQGMAVPQLPQTARFGLEHSHLCGAVELDEIGLSAILQAHGLIDAAPAHRTLVHDGGFFPGNRRKLGTNRFPQ